MDGFRFGVWGLGLNVVARIIDPPPSTKTFGLNSVEPGAPLGRIWVPLIKLEGNCGGRGVWGLAQDLRTFDKVRRELRGPRVWGAPRMRGCPGVGLGDKLFTVVIQ